MLTILIPLFLEISPIHISKVQWITPAFKRQKNYTAKQTCAVSSSIHTFNGISESIVPCASPTIVLLKTHISHEPPTIAFAEVKRAQLVILHSCRRCNEVLATCDLFIHTVPYHVFLGQNYAQNVLTCYYGCP